MKFTHVRAFALALSLVVVSPSFLYGASGIFYYPNPGPWDAKAMQLISAWIAGQNYENVMPYLYYYTETDPKEAVVQLILKNAREWQQVPMMYMMVRHYVRRLDRGSMLSQEEFLEMFVYLLLSLVRTQEDYLGCVTVEKPHEGAPKVYALLKWKYWYWLSSYLDKTSITYQQAFQRMREILQRTDYDRIPNLAWILHCYGKFKSTIIFGSPTELEQRKFQDNAESVKAARLAKQGMVLQDFAIYSEWKNFFADVRTLSWSEWFFSS
ncbi:hypothetical protein K2W90_05745 [Candidatus Babeliales bacterium]|nr:hypothetical protein [Candidatus Babeliales bacterium]